MKLDESCTKGKQQGLCHRIRGQRCQVWWDEESVTRIVASGGTQWARTEREKIQQALGIHSSSEKG